MPKRKSVTDNMSSDAEKLMSGVDRRLISILDSEVDEEELSKIWPDHPQNCIVVVPDIKGHFRYITSIPDRLISVGFDLSLRYPHRVKVPGQLTVQEEAAMKKRQATEGAEKNKQNKHEPTSRLFAQANFEDNPLLPPSRDPDCDFCGGSGMVKGSECWFCVG